MQTFAVGLLAIVIATALPHFPEPPMTEPPAPAGRIYTSDSLHVGLRPFVLCTSDGPELAGGFTLQVSAKVF